MPERDLRALADSYLVPAALALVVVVMLWIRLLDADSVFRGGQVYFSGNDPWYHARIVQYTVANFPATPAFDPYSQFPWGTGRHSGFGGLFDQLVALAALVVGLGSPSAHTVDVVTALAPPVFGAATAVPVYLFAKRVYDRWTGLTAVALLALVSGGFLYRTAVGVSDHQSAEAFFGALAALGFVYAVTTAYETGPLPVDVRERNWDLLRRPLAAGVLGGVLVASYLMTWGPGVFLVFTMGVFVVVQACRDFLRREPVAFLGFGTVTCMVTASVLTLLYTKRLVLEATAFSLLQPLVCLVVAVGAVVLVALSQFLSRRNAPRWQYPAAVVALLGASLVVAALVFPPALDLLWNLVTRIYSFGLLKTSTGLTVAELSPGTVGGLWQAYGPILALALAGGAVLVASVWRDNRPPELFLLLWTLTTLSAYATMVRFGYYVAVVVVVLAAVAVAWVLRDLFGVRAADGLDLQAHQVVGVLLVVLLVVPGNVVAVGGLNPAWQTAEFASGSDQAWQGELSWMAANTPPEPLSYTRSYERPAGGDYAYPEGAYGVLSWWDYGHWITHTARRVPVANPFQQSPRIASAYLQAQDEGTANTLLEALPAMNSSTDVRNFADESGSVASMRPELDGLAASRTDQEAGEDVRYVVVDDQMVAASGPRKPGLRRKFNPITTWAGPGFDTYVSSQPVALQTVQDGRFVSTDRTVRLPALDDDFQRTMISRLYFQDTAGLEHYRLVHESDATTQFLNVAQVTQGGDVRSLGWFNSMLTSRTFRALQRQGVFAYNVRQESRVKVFERVPGATLSGRVDPARVGENTTVAATVELETERGRQFRYVQRAPVASDGSFSVTVPYATTDDVPPADGGTDTGVTATGEYTVVVGGDGDRSVTQVAVPETAVYDGESVTVTFDG